MFINDGMQHSQANVFVVFFLQRPVECAQQVHEAQIFTVFFTTSSLIISILARLGHLTWQPLFSELEKLEPSPLYPIPMSLNVSIISLYLRAKDFIKSPSHPPYPHLSLPTAEGNRVLHICNILQFSNGTHLHQIDKECQSVHCRTTI